ncbi:GNAT family N-acetyltransferase [Flexivirga caeni]|uniref:GNAT family N-acetyltransferase n=1 Tax=Flexivirga caeni TaxID=2294115 RepID=A0A3M9MJ16_9MICO|nr:GNAT family N-acetyltransferase [Flexivirga caeni]RNI25185.1 GNAT family N-acetyltransferase [Flexivirga caeni]
MTIEVRRARDGDEDALVDLRAEMFRAMGMTNDANGWQETARSWFAARLGDPHLGIFVVTQDGSVVACAMGMVRDAGPSPTAPEGRDILISNVCTAPDQRRRGYGQAAFDAVLDWCRAQGVSRLELMATDAGRPMYERAGFETRPRLMRATLSGVS